MYYLPLSALTLILAFNFVRGDVELIRSLSSHLSIRHCIEVSTQTESGIKNRIQDVKEFSKSFMFLQVCKPIDFIKVIKGEIYPKTLVVIMDKSLFKNYNEVQNGLALSSLHWLIIEEREREESEEMWQLDENVPKYVPVDRNFWIARKLPTHNNTFAIDTLYQLRSDSPKIIETYGKFTPELGLEAPSIEPSVTRRNFHAMIFVVFNPIVNICKLVTPCLHKKLWDDFSCALNFTKVEVNAEKLEKIYNGKCDGEVMYTPFHHVAIKENILGPTMKGTVNMYIKDTFGSQGNSWMTFSRPLEGDVWVCLAGWVLLSSVILVILHYFIGFQTPFIMESAFTPLDAICWQGGSMTTSNSFTRWSVLMLRILAAILLPAYSAAIVSFITVQTPLLPFNDIMEFYKDGTYRLGGLRIDTFSMNYFKGSSIPEFQVIAKRMQIPESELMFSYEENMQYLCHQNKFAFLAYNNLFELVRAPCKVIKIPNPIAYSFAGLPLAVGSPYKLALTWVLARLRCGGVTARIQKELVRALENIDGTIFYPITLEQVILPFIIFGTGGMWAIAEILVEQLNIKQSIRISKVSMGLHAEHTTFVKKMSEMFTFSNIIHPDYLESLEMEKMTQTRKTLLIFSYQTFVNTFSAMEKKRLSARVNWLVEGNVLTTTLPVYVPMDVNMWVTRGFSQVSMFYQLTSASPYTVEPYSLNKPQDLGLRTNLMGATLVLFLPIPNYCHFKSICGHVKMWEDFSSALNFTIKMVDAQNLITKFNGKYDGQGFVTPLHSQSQVNLLAPTIKGWVNMYIKDTFGFHGESWFAFIKPFEVTVWVCLGAWLFTSSTAFALMHYLSGDSWPSIVEGSFIPVNAICCQGEVSGKGNKVSRTSRWAALATYMLTTVVLPAYSAAVISFITVQLPSLPFYDIIGFRRDGTYRVGCLKQDNFTKNYFKESASIDLQDIASRLQLPESALLTTYEENANRLCSQKKLAFLAYNNLFEEVWAPCKIVRIPVPVTAFFAGLPLAPDSPYKHGLKLLLYRMKSSGYTDRLQKNLSQSVISNSEVTFISISLAEVRLPFLIATVGLIFATVIVCVERRVKRIDPSFIRRRRFVIQIANYV